MIRNGKNPRAGHEFEYGTGDDGSYETSAFVTGNWGKFLIFRRKNSPYPRREDLEHELWHIYNGDIEKVETGKVR